jgi:4a-hydroxytetrahydrobiopterin dehydratase
MPAPKKLDESELRSAVTSLPGWTLVQGKLHREYKFADFVHAFGFMATSAIAIEKMNHHPEWFNVWNARESEARTTERLRYPRSQKEGTRPNVSL